jgi:hypothetical protein
MSTGLAHSDGVHFLTAEAGSRPGGRGTFLCFAKETYPKERRPTVCDPFAALRGKPASGRFRGAPWNSLRAARCAQTTTASQMTKRVCPAAHPLTPQPPRRRRRQMGVSPTRAVAGLGPQRARTARPKHQAERSDGPKGCLLPTLSGCAWGAQGAGWRVCRRTHPHRCLARRGCLNGAQQARSEFHGAPRTRAPQVAPARSAGVADSRVAFSLVTFFWRSKRKLLARRATPGSRPQHGHAVATTKSIAASA